jgi:hypothetical protein
MHGSTPTESEMNSERLASVIINNYNYERYLPHAIESALGQTYRNVEVIVVDDGSRDGSRDVIGRYADRVTTVFKENGGQASAMNAGYGVSHGELTVFLDADDMLLPHAIERSMHFIDQPDLTKVHWALWEIDAEGQRTGNVWPKGELPSGDLRHQIARAGPSGVRSPPTSGNAWTRKFLDAVMPIPPRYTLCADDYLYTLAPALGTIACIDRPHGLYRVHGRNNHQSRDFEERVEFGLQVQLEQCTLLEAALKQQQIAADSSGWESTLWYVRLDRALRAISTYVPSAEPFLLVDASEWGAPPVLMERPCFAFPTRDGKYWGPPASDASAIEELEQRRSSGVTRVVIAWPAYWWLEYYTGFAEHLRAIGECLWSDELITVFRLSRSEVNDAALIEASH